LRGGRRRSAEESGDEDASKESGDQELGGTIKGSKRIKRKG